MSDEQPEPPELPQVPPVPPTDAPTFVSPGEVPTTPPSLPPGVAAPVGYPAHADAPGQATPPTSTIDGATAGDERQRPTPVLVSVAAAGGGILAALGLFAITSDTDITRGPTIAISLLFAIAGFGLLLWNRSRRAIAAGVALLGLASIPLASAVVGLSNSSMATDSFTFGDTNLKDTIESMRDKQIGMLALLAVIWLACYLVGPGRRQAFFLGAALFALWLVPMTHFSTSATASTFQSLSSPSIDLTDPSFDGSGSGSIDSSGAFDDLSSTLGDATDATDTLPRKLAITSLAFGTAYLALAGWLDAKHQARAATALFAAAAVILWQGLGYLSADLSPTGVGAIGIVLGAAGVWLGTKGGRRFTSWLGVASIVVSITSIVSDHLDGATSTGVLLAVIGVAVVVAASLFERGTTPEVASEPPQPF